MATFQPFARVRVLLWVAGLSSLVLSGPAVFAGLPPAAAATGAALDWGQYLHGPQHSSVSLATAFTPANAVSASRVWHWQPPAITGKPAPRLEASPTVAAGRVYIGAESGGFYALNETTVRLPGAGNSIPSRR
jgi:PQQ-like domain